MNEENAFEKLQKIMKGKKNVENHKTWENKKLEGKNFYKTTKSVVRIGKTSWRTNV
jgi:hypothetical protein